MMMFSPLFQIPGTLDGPERVAAERTIVANHYAHSFPSGKSHVFDVDGCIVVFSIPANKNIGRFVLGRKGAVWELTRLWAADGHEPNLLTRAMSVAIGMFRQTERNVEALVSFADPNVGHHGGIYRAASWVFTGSSSEGRYYRDACGQVVARRKFHSGSKCLSKAEIMAKGFEQLKMPGKLRFVKGLSKAAKRDIARLWSGHSVPL